MEEIKIDDNIISENVNLRNVQVLRGETQKDVNYIVLEYIISKFNKDNYLKALDLPCGSMLFLNYLRMFFPGALLYGADINKPAHQDSLQFIAMDLSEDFPLPIEEKFDLITSISGVMMFSNTLTFISNCAGRLNKGGTFIITNDNSSTIKDKLSFLLLGHHRQFKLVYEDAEAMTQIIPIQELCRLLRTNNLLIEEIKFTSFYRKDLIYLPIAILIYPMLWLYIRCYKTKLPSRLKWQMFPFKHCLFKHYIIIARKA